MSSTKTFRESLSDMVDWIVSSGSSLNNFHVGGVVRTLLEATALEIESLYYQMQKGFKRATRDSIYDSFGHTKLAPVASTGNVYFKFKAPLISPLVLSAGYRVSSIPVNGISLDFELVQQTYISPGSTDALLSFKCTQAGEIGNVPANTIKIPSIKMVEIDEITNPLPFVGGKEQESDEDRKKRFSKFIESLSKGTVAAIEYGCLKVPEVIGVSVDDQIGIVRAYVHNAAGELPDSVRKDVQNSLINYRAAGIEVLVLPVTKRQINLTINLTLNSGFDPAIYNAIVESEVQRYLNRYQVSRSFIVADVIRFIMDIDRSAIANARINVTEDIPVAKSEIIRPGTISVSTV